MPFNSKFKIPEGDGCRTSIVKILSKNIDQVIIKVQTYSFDVKLFDTEVIIVIRFITGPS
jgi:hypothetical protein